MRIRITRGAAAAAFALLATLSCSDSTAPLSKTTAELNLLHVAHGTPPLVSTQRSFYAVKGQPVAVDLWFHAPAGSTDSLKLLEYRMAAGSLDRRPDGSAIAVGDSVLITLTVTDPYHLVIEYQPSGLTFTATDQPTLTMFWSACGDDLNYDGVVDAADAAITDQLGVWRQEATDQPWYRQNSVIVKSTKEVSTQLPGFSGYALAY